MANTGNWKLFFGIAIVVLMHLIKDIECCSGERKPYGGNLDECRVNFYIGSLSYLIVNYAADTSLYS